jgi:hypothetical protein
MIEKRHEAVLKPEHARIAGFASTGLSFLAGLDGISESGKAGTDRADRQVIFIGH